MSLINNAPINGAIVQKDGYSVGAFSNWLQQAFGLLFDVQNSGTTAQRPTTRLYPGKTYFDTSLGASGKPIWVNKTSSGWVDATGAPV